MTETGTSMRSRLGGPASVAALTASTAAALYVRDPRSSTYFPCPFHAMTGLWCPGCGATRAVGDLIRGDVASAVSSNALAIVLVVASVAGWGLWVAARVRGRPLSIQRPPLWVLLSGLVVVFVFTVLRNLPVGSAFAP